MKEPKPSLKVVMLFNFLSNTPPDQYNWKKHNPLSGVASCSSVPEEKHTIFAMDSDMAKSSPTTLRCGGVLTSQWLPNVIAAISDFGD